MSNKNDYLKIDKLINRLHTYQFKQLIQTSKKMGAICCCVGCCCGDCVDGCKKWLGPEKVTKIFYFVLVIVFVIPAIFVFFFLSNWTKFKQYFSKWISCPDTSGEQAFACIGSSVIFRLSLCLLILFFVMMLLMLPRRRLSMIINESCFCIKYLLVVALFIGSLWIPNKTFQDYGEASKYISILYMIMQSIILIDLFYLAGIKMVKRYDEGETQYGCYLIFLSIIFEAVAILMNVLGYVFFSKSEEGCDNTIWVNVITTIILVILPIITLLRFNPQNSLLTTALVSLFLSYLCFICQYSFDGGDDITCNRMNVGSMVGDISASTFFFILTMYGSIMGGTGQVKVTRDGNINNAMGVGDQLDTEDAQHKEKYGAAKQNSNQSLENDETNEQKYTQTFAWVKWHFYMCLASIYIAMLITNWTSASIQGAESEQVFSLGPSSPGFWIRLIIAWLTFLLYVWTMIAPRVCPSRDFQVE